MTKSEEVTVSDKEIQEVEAQVKAEAEKAKVGAERQIEERVRKEVSMEQRAKELEAAMEAQKADLAKAQAELEAARKESESLIKQRVEERLKQEQSARSKVPVSAGNPFTPPPSSGEAPFLERLRKDPGLMQSVESDSYRALMSRRQKE